jgi:hypothetical protein
LADCVSNRSLAAATDRSRFGMTLLRGQEIGWQEAAGSGRLSRRAGTHA